MSEKGGKIRDSPQIILGATKRSEKLVHFKNGHEYLVETRTTRIS
jgi:hypothetical protein